MNNIGMGGLVLHFIDTKYADYMATRNFRF